MPSFEHMVAMNPNDNQGVRLLLGVPYHELGEHADALRWYRKTTDEAHVLFNWAPLCWEMYKRADAVLHIVQGSIEHLCLAPQLLCQSAPRYAFWHASNREEPEFAAEYVELYRHLWR